MTTSGAETGPTDWVTIARELGPAFAERAAEHDAADAFVADNYAALKERGFFKAGVPAELGGGGAMLGELCAMIRELGHHCSSTALAASMHTHTVAMMSALWRSGNKGPEPLLRRVAAEGLMLVSSGGSDWLAGSGRLEKVEGGYKMTGRKIFASGVPAGHVLMTTGIFDDPESGPTVIHFGVPLNAPGVKVLDTWHALGMRGTGSHDVELEGVFLPDAVMGGVRRPPGKWHPSGTSGGHRRAAHHLRRLPGRRRGSARHRAGAGAKAQERSERALPGGRDGEPAGGGPACPRRDGRRRALGEAGARDLERPAHPENPGRDWRARHGRAGDRGRRGRRILPRAHGSNACFATFRPAAITRFRRNSRRG